MSQCRVMSFKLEPVEATMSMSNSTSTTTLPSIASMTANLNPSTQQFSALLSNMFNHYTKVPVANANHNTGHGNNITLLRDNHNHNQSVAMDAMNSNHVTEHRHHHHHDGTPNGVVYEQKPKYIKQEIPDGDMVPADVGYSSSHVVSPPVVDKGHCQVCGERANGNFFGALVCLPCKTFFIRCSSEEISTFRCRRNSDCDITGANRSRCKSCRYYKCISAGMLRRERPEHVEVTDGQQLCVVCGDVANGVHFGVTSCEGCKKFFRRGLQEAESYMCKNSMDCTINPKTRNECRFCRFRKCLGVGMSRESIKMGRPKKRSSADRCGPLDGPQPPDTPSPTQAASPIGALSTLLAKSSLFPSAERKSHIHYHPYKDRSETHNRTGPGSGSGFLDGGMDTMNLMARNSTHQRPDLGLSQSTSQHQSISLGGHIDRLKLEDEQSRLHQRHQLELQRCGQGLNSAPYERQLQDNHNSYPKTTDSNFYQYTGPMMNQRHSVPVSEVDHRHRQTLSNIQNSAGHSHNNLPYRPHVEQRDKERSMLENILKKQSNVEYGHAHENFVYHNQAFIKQGNESRNEVTCMLNGHVEHGVHNHMFTGNHGNQQPQWPAGSKPAAYGPSYQATAPKQCQVETSINVQHPIVREEASVQPQFPVTIEEAEIQYTASTMKEDAVIPPPQPQPQRQRSSSVGSDSAQKSPHGSSVCSGYFSDDSLEDMDCGSPLDYSKKKAQDNDSVLASPASASHSESDISDLNMESGNSTSEETEKPVEANTGSHCTNHVWQVLNEDRSVKDKLNESDWKRKLERYSTYKFPAGYWLRPYLAQPYEATPLSGKHQDIIEHMQESFEEFVTGITSIDAKVAHLSDWEAMKSRIIYQTSDVIAFLNSIPGFRDVDLGDKYTLIRLGGIQCCTLMAARYLYDTTNHKFMSSFYECPLYAGNQQESLKQALLEYAGMVQEADMDTVEIALLTAIMVLATDWPDLERSDIIEFLRSQLVESFKAYVVDKYGAETSRIHDLYSLIPRLRELGMCHYKLTFETQLAHQV